MYNITCAARQCCRARCTSQAMRPLVGYGGGLALTNGRTGCLSADSRATGGSNARSRVNSGFGLAWSTAMWRGWLAVGESHIELDCFYSAQQCHIDGMDSTAPTASAHQSPPGPSPMRVRAAGDELLTSAAPRRRASSAGTAAGATRLRVWDLEVDGASPASPWRQTRRQTRRSRLPSGLPHGRRGWACVSARARVWATLR
mmetsp:Transcript_14133/g.32246  ORF Transcript_14133/g.32246 Transcript_14133/m.32246 type:complete len:201 (+) Transcript_14133:384-986(+)